MNGSPSNAMNGSAVMSPQSSLSTNMNQSIRVHSPATATPAMRAPKEAFRPKGMIRFLIFFISFLVLLQNFNLFRCFSHRDSRSKAIE